MKINNHLVTFAFLFKITWFKHAAYLEHSHPLFSDVYKHVQASTRSLIIFIIFFFAQKVIFVHIVDRLRPNSKKKGSTNPYKIKSNDYFTFRELYV